MPLDQMDVDNMELPDGGTEMSFFEHIEVLRWHLFRSVLSVFILAIVFFVFKDWIFENIIFGPRYPEFITYKIICGFSEMIGMGERLCMQPTEFEVDALGLGEAFILTLKSSAIGGFIVAFPYIMWEMWRFIKPGLYEKEQKKMRGFVLIVSALFFTGVLFGYYVVSPFAVNFLVNFSVPDVANKPQLSSYVNYMLSFVLPAGIIFELPVLVYFLARIGLITGKFMRTYRKHAIILILIMAAMITPPDAVTQFFIGIPLYFLYEVSIRVAERVERQKKEELEEALA